MHIFPSIDIKQIKSKLYILINFPAISLLDLDSLGCLYRYITARPIPLCFRVSWLTLGSWGTKTHTCILITWELGGMLILSK